MRESILRRLAPEIERSELELTHDFLDALSHALARPPAAGPVLVLFLAMVHRDAPRHPCGREIVAVTRGCDSAAIRFALRKLALQAATVGAITPADRDLIDTMTGEAGR